MISPLMFEDLCAMRWQDRYKHLTELCRGEQATMPYGQLEASTAFAKRLFPGLMDRSASEVAAFHHWLRMVALHNGAAAGHEMVMPTRGFSKGKVVKKWLWGRKIPDTSNLV